jgi:hypothetical protein
MVLHTKVYSTVHYDSGFNAYWELKCTESIELPGKYRFDTRVRHMATLRHIHLVQVIACRFNPEHWSINPAHHSIIEAPILSVRAATF